MRFSYFQITPSVEPVTAIHTTDTADGTRVRKSAKCNLARRKPEGAKVEERWEKRESREQYEIKHQAVVA